ncbi:ATP-binding protein [Rapidithrix thailandica]|uniref:histidine kinase n=1 Tax=Rapidithrix thailandica TaxID=413964 RepID=A0AAW9RXB1_9BACT
MKEKSIIKILLIEDDEDDYIITRDILDEITYQKYAIDWISDYHQATELIGKKEHDVYLVDYRFGAHNGLEIIRKSIEGGSDLPFILLTGQGDLEIDRQAMRIGATDYLVKGKIDASILERSIRHSMEITKNIRKINTLNQDLEQRVQERTRQLQQTNENLQKEIEVRRKTEKALRQSQKLYSTIAHNFPKGAIAVLDTDLNIIFIDGKELENLGFSRQELKDKCFVDIFYQSAHLSPQEKANVTQQFQRIFKNEQVKLEFTYNLHQFEVNGVPLYDLEGKVEQVLVVANNITEQKKAEEDIRNALQKEKELNELKSRFVSMASHEFRTPLSTIMSSVSLISRYTGSEHGEKRLKHINRVKSNVNHLTQILNDFLSISKLEEGKMELHPACFQIEELCGEITEDMQAVAKRGQQIAYSHPTNGLEICLDRQILKNILINLLSNAIKYSPEDKKIDFVSTLEKQQLVIRISDKGIGIPEEEQQHLFSRFFRAENAINIQGTGLGLHIVKKYVDMLGGSISYQSKLNQGTTFMVTLPCQ